MRVWLKPLLIFGVLLLVVVLVSWLAFPAWRSQPGGLASLIGVAAAGLLAFAKGALDAYKTWVEIEEKKKTDGQPSETTPPSSSTPPPVTVNTGGGPAQVNTGAVERMVQAGTYVEQQYPPPEPEKPPTGSGLPPSHAPKFIDRGPIMDEIRRRIRERQQTAIVGVGGMGGVGKTELVRHLAAEMAESAPESVLWLDVADRPLSDVHQRLARALGVTLPPTADAQQNYEILCAAFYQSPVRLLVLDDIRRSFLESLPYCLPPSPPCTVLLTSRLNLPAVPAGGMIVLDVMTEQQALELLHSIPGLEEAAAREPEAARELVRLCACHPLALDLAARRLLRRVKRSAAPIADFNAQLTNRLEQLREGDERLQSLRANFDLSYTELSPADQGYFRRLAVCAETGFTPALAAALWQCDAPEAMGILERLSDASLVLPPERAAGRWRLHDLLRDYAGERLREAGEASATQRLLAGWIIALFKVHFIDDPDVAPYVEAELDNLRAAADWAVKTGEGELLAQLVTWPRNWLYNVFRVWEEWYGWLTQALQLGITEPQLRANVLKAQGDVLAFLKRNDEALARYEAALGLYRAVGARLGEANVLQAQGDVLAFLKRNDEALARYEAALGLYRAVGARLGEANVLQAQGDVLAFRKQNDEALARYEAALGLFRAVGDRLGEANTLRAQGDVLAFLDRRDEALARYEAALGLFRAVGDRLGEANVLKAQGDVLAFLKRNDEALARYEAALGLYRAVGARLGEANVLQAQGDVLAFLKRNDEALARYEAALGLYRAVGARLGEANVLQAQGDVLAFRKQNDEALARYEAALGLYRAVGARLGEANVYSAQGQVYLLSDRQEEAKQMLAKAINIYEIIGDRYSIPAQIGNYGWALLQAGKFAEAYPYFEQAVPLFEAIGLDDYAQRHHQAALWCKQQLEEGGGTEKAEEQREVSSE